MEIANKAITGSDKYPIRCNMGNGVNLFKWKSELFNMVKGLSHTLFNLDLWQWPWTNLGQTYSTTKAKLYNVCTILWEIVHCGAFLVPYGFADGVISILI